jgi:hypothetical protein
MLLEIVVRRAAEVRELIDRGVLSGLRVPLRDGGTLPAGLFAKVAFDDLDYQTGLARGRDEVDSPAWRQLAEDIELLHEVALAREYANAPIRFPA